MCPFDGAKGSIMLYQKDNVHGGDIYQDQIDLDFSVNINPLGTPEAVKKAVRDAAERIGCYPDPYCRKLVRAIAGYEQIPEHMVICGNGAAELIYAFCRGAAPERAVLTAPTFAEYELALQESGCEIFRYCLSRELGFQLDEGFLSFLELKHPDVLFLCNPNNPDGRETGEKLLLQILDLSRREGIRVLLDECFADLSDHQISAKGSLAEYPNVFILKAFTKNYAMAGIRLGYGLCSDPLFLKKISDETQPWNISLPAQEAGVAALQDRQIIEEARAVILQQRGWLSMKLQELGLRVYPSEANYILVQGPEGLERELRRRKIAIRDCANYPGLEAGWYRIAVKQEDENQRLIEAMREAGL